MILLLLLLSSLALPSRAPGARLKDLAAIEGVRDNQLVGYGIVVGLAGTGDRRQTIFSAQSLANLLERMGVQVSGAALRVNNTASVMVTATLPPFAQSGGRIDVTVASMGDASNLQGGLLLMTPLKGPDGQVYAVAQGPVVTGGFGAGRAGSSRTVNHPTVGRVAEGALVERQAPSVSPTGLVKLQLRRADFTTASRVTAAINKQFGAALANAENAAVIAVRMPASKSSADFVAGLEAVEVEADSRTRIVINERTGTIIMGKQVRIRPVAIMHGNLSVEIRTHFDVSQPAPLSQGKTVVVPDVKVQAKEEKASNIMLDDGATVEDLVRALSSIGSTPRDVIAILESLRVAGALEADMEVI
jgi:flagellar P-ring protein precursor FlgI